MSDRETKLYAKGDNGGKSVADLILEYCKVPRSLSEIYGIVGASCCKDTLRRWYLRTLVEKGELVFTAYSKFCRNKEYVTQGYEKCNVATEEKILEFCKEPRTRIEMRECFGMSKFNCYKIVKQLLDDGKLIGDMPKSPSNMLQRFVAVQDNSVCQTVIERLLHFCVVPRSRAEISFEMGLSWKSVNDMFVSKLLKEGKIRFEYPNNPKCRCQRFVVVDIKN